MKMLFLIGLAIFLNKLFKQYAHHDDFNAQVKLPLLMVFVERRRFYLFLFLPPRPCATMVGGSFMYNKLTELIIFSVF